MMFRLRFMGMNVLLAAIACLVQFSARAVEFRPFTLGEPEPFYRNFNTANGLPSSECYDIHQDRRGYIWIATDRGVVRYDGFRFKVFTTRNGLVDDVVFKLYEDPKGRIWFVSFGGLLCYWEAPAGEENGKIHPYKYNNYLRKYIGQLTTTFKTLAVDEHDRIYYALYNLGGLCIDASGKVTMMQPKGKPSITVMKAAGRWLPVCYLPSGRYFSLIVRTKKQQYSLGKFEFGPTMLNMSEHYLEVDQLVYDVLTRKVILREQHAIGIDCLDGDVFVGLYQKGVRRERISLPENHPKRTSYLLRGHSVSAVARDREGGYWFATLDNGIYYTPNLIINNYSTAQGLANMEYSVIGGIGNDVYVSDPMSMTRLSQPSLRIDTDRHRKHPGIGASLRKIYFNSDTKEQFSSVGKYTFLPGNMCAFHNADKYVLVSGGMIIRLYDNGHLDTLYYPFVKTTRKKDAVNFLYNVTETAEGKVYAGNIHGVFEIRNQKAEQAHLKDPMFQLRVTAFEQHPELKTIVATRSKGIYCFDENYKITRRITKKDGLLSDLVSCLYVDKQGYIFVGTNHGLTILKLRKDGTFQRWSMTTNQGLCSNEITSVYRHGSQIWIATKRGVSTFDVNEVKVIPRGGIALAHISADGRILEPKRSGLSLNSNVQLVEVAIRTDNFSGTGHHKFLYQLRRGGAWLPVNDPDITLNEPRWGEYQVVVKFRNDNGTWSKAVPIVSFTVEAPFYAKWYFILFVSLGFLAIVFWIFKVVLRRVKQRHTYQTTINQLEQKALRAQMNPHFIFNSLNSIQSFLVFEENEKAERYLLKFAQLIRQTLNNSRESYITIESEIDTLARYLELEQMRFKDKFGFEIISHLSREALTHGIPPMLIQPFVENAVLHGFRSVESGGKVEVRFEELKDIHLLCIVEDNGVGRKATERRQEDGHKSFGTLITAERLAAFKQKYGDDFTIEIIDKEEGGKAMGTKVVLLIPVVPPTEIMSMEDVV